MADYVTRVRTERGDLQIDYNALANLPETDKTLTKSGECADAKVTGDKINKLTEDLKALDESVIKSINGLTPGDDGDLTLTPEDIGAVSASDPYVGTIGGLHGDIELGDGLDVDAESNSIVNTGVLSVVTGGVNGTISVNTGGVVADVAVNGLKSAAYTESEIYATQAMFTLDRKNQILRITMPGAIEQ
jgi:hypothetical protein